MKTVYTILMCILLYMPRVLFAQNRNYTEIAMIQGYNSGFTVQDGNTILYIHHGDNRKFGENSSALVRYSIDERRSDELISTTDMQELAIENVSSSLHNIWVLENNLYIFSILSTGYTVISDDEITGREYDEGYAVLEKDGIYIKFSRFPDTSYYLYNPEDKAIHGFDVLAESYKIRQLPSDPWVFMYDKKGEDKDRSYSVIDLRSGAASQVFIPDFLENSSIAHKYIQWGREADELLCVRKMDYGNYQMVFFNSRSRISLQQFILPPETREMSLSPDGRYLVTHNRGKGIFIYDLITRAYQPEKAFADKKKTDRVYLCGWSPDSSFFFLYKWNMLYMIHFDEW